jgi:hypothetical protein
MPAPVFRGLLVTFMLPLDEPPVAPSVASGPKADPVPLEPMTPAFTPVPSAAWAAGGIGNKPIDEVTKVVVGRDDVEIEVIELLAVCEPEMDADEPDEDVAESEAVPDDEVA